MCEPAFDLWIHLAVSPCIGRWRHTVEEVGIGSSPDDDAGVSMAGGHHAHPARFQMEAVGLGEPGERVPRHGEVVLQALQLVCCINSHVVESLPVEAHAEQILLVVVGNGDCDSLML